MFKIFICILSGFSVGFGLWCIKNPKQAIEMQIAFYRLINWRMEPLDWKLETRNTRLMGLFSLICGIVAFLWIFSIFRR